MALLALHRAVDDLAMWTEDRKPRAPIPFRGAPPAPLDCFGPLPDALPPPPGPAGPWRAPSPRPCPGDLRMAVESLPARGRHRGTVILVPPWKLPRLSLLSGWAEVLAGTGHDVWTLVPPRHLHRAAPGIGSGEGFVSPDLPAVRAAMEQLVVELRLLVAGARARRGGQVGLVGLSLGGLAALLAATAPEAADFVAAIGPPADLAAVFGRTRIGRRYLGLATRAGAPPPPQAEVDRMLAPFRPDLRAPTAARAWIAVGTEDRIALLDGARAVAGRWGAGLSAYARGHLTLLFACGAVRRDLAAFAAGPR
jgi:hypothetical protein